MLASTGNGNNGNGGNFEIDDFGTGPYNPTTVATNRFFIEGTTGNVGIGTIAPSERFHTTGGVRFQGLTTGGAPNSAVLADANGKLWLGSITSLGNYCGQSANSLLGNYDIPLGNSNFFFSGNSVAQQQKVNIGIPCNATMPGKLNVATALPTDVNGDSYGLYATTTNGSVANLKTGIYGAAVNTSGPGTGFSRGVHGYCSSIGWMALGVLGEAGPALRAWGGRFTSLNVGNDTNFGVQGLASGSPLNYGGYFDASYPNAGFNYGVYASASGGQNTWAGYFVGDVNITGNGWINGIAITSDGKLKENIQPLSEAASKVKLLKPSTYNFRTEEFKEMNLPSGNQIGLIAQELEKVFPELVHQQSASELRNKEGDVTGTIPAHKTVNYIGLIPVLIAAIQEQQRSIETQQRQIDELQSMLSSLSNSSSFDSQTGLRITDNEIPVILEQNVPNPFAESTVINYTIPDNCNTAELVFTNSNGIQIKTIALDKKGSGNVRVYGSDLSHGMYSYSLVIDGKKSASKKMVKN